MEITLNKKSNTEGLIKIRLTEGDYQPQVEEKMRDYARKASLKGFRPGKVPPGIIRKMFGKSIMVDEINHLLNHKISDYIKENKLRVLGDPLPNTEKASTIDWENQKDFEFEYQIGMVEEFKYELSTRIKIKSHPITLGEETITESVNDLRQRFGKVSYPELSEAGDSLFGTLTAIADGTKVEGVLIPVDKVKERVRGQFLGRKKEDVVQFNMADLSDDKEFIDELTGDRLPQNGEFEFTLQVISRIEAAPLNQDLFDRVFGKGTATNEAEFRDKVAATISRNYERETNHFVEHCIEDYLVARTKINIPEDFLKLWIKRTDEKSEITDDVLEKEFHSYARKLKWDLIKNKIVEDHKIAVGQDDIRNRARDLIVSQFGGPEFASQIQDKMDGIIDNYLNHDNGKNYLKLYGQLREEKIFAVIKSNITIEEKQVDVEAFKKIVGEHKHE